MLFHLKAVRQPLPLAIATHFDTTVDFVVPLRQGKQVCLSHCALLGCVGRSAHPQFATGSVTY